MNNNKYNKYKYDKYKHCNNIIIITYNKYN